MRNGNAKVEAGDCSDEGGCGVALNEDDVWRDFREDPTKGRKGRAREACKQIAGPIGSEFNVEAAGEQFEDRLDGRVLPRRDDVDVELVRTGHRAGDGRELDGFGTRTEDDG